MQYSPTHIGTAAAFMLAMGLMPQADAAFVEDFTSGWQNNASNNLGATASLNGWTFDPETAERFRIENDYLTNWQGSGQLQHKTAGKAHAQELAGMTRIDLSFDASMAPSNVGGDSAVEAWVGDGSQNGYGLTLLRTDTDNQLAITKLYDGTSAFGATRNASQDSTAYASYVSEGTNAFQRVHLRIEQSEPGGDVTLTAWSDAIGNSSYDAPLVQVVDSGDASSDLDAALMDLSSLTHAGLALRRNFNSGGVARIDNIYVEAVPEPASLGLLAAGSLLFLRRRR